MEAREIVRRNIADLDTLQEPERLAAVAVSLAESGDPEAIGALSRHLRQKAFLERLDDATDPQMSIYNLTQVFDALERNSTRHTAELCVDLAAEPDFIAEPVRLNSLLPALAAVQPMSDGAAEIFRRTSDEGFFHLNAPLLVQNGSPLALAVFEEIMESSSQDAANRVDAIHRSILPYRTHIAILRMCSRLLQKDLEPQVEAGLIETLFDYQERKWFGNARRPPRPPSWGSASTEELRVVVELGSRLQERTNLPIALREAIRSTVVVINDILAGREA